LGIAAATEQKKKQAEDGKVGKFDKHCLLIELKKQRWIRLKKTKSTAALLVNMIF
jgi:hypothetical protein